MRGPRDFIPLKDSQNVRRRRSVICGTDGSTRPCDYGDVDTLPPDAIVGRNIKGVPHMKLIPLFLAVATLICGASLAHASDRNNGAGLTPGHSRLKERSTTGMGTHDSIQPRRETYSQQNFPPQPEPRNPYMRADRDDFPVSSYRH